MCLWVWAAVCSSPEPACWAGLCASAPAAQHLAKPAVAPIVNQLVPLPPTTLPQDRVRIEAEALQAEAAVCPAHVPAVCSYDARMCIIAMQVGVESGGGGCWVEVVLVLRGVVCVGGVDLRACASLRCRWWW